MAEHPNVSRVRAAVAAYGDAPASMAPFLSDDIVWHVGGDHPLSGDYRGRDAVLEYFARVRDGSDGGLHLEPVNVMADDEHAAIFMRVTGSRGDVQLDTVMAEALRLDAQGRWSEFWALADDQDAVDAFWRAT